MLGRLAPLYPPSSPVSPRQSRPTLPSAFEGACPSCLLTLPGALFSSLTYPPRMPKSPGGNEAALFFVYFDFGADHIPTRLTESGDVN